MRDSFIFYKSFYEGIKELNSDIQCEIYNAIMEYEFNQTETELSGVAKSIFTLIKPQLEANNKRYQNGCKGGRPKTKTKPKENQTKTKPKPNDNENDNVNVNDNKKENIKRRNFVKPTLEEIQAYCIERNNNVNPKTFLDYYEINNWVDSNGNKVKNWKQKVITWEKRNPKQNTKEEKLPDWFNKNLELESDLSEEDREFIRQVERSY